MLIGMDARFAVSNRRGIGNYVLQLIRNLSKIDNMNRYILYVDNDDRENVFPKQENFRIRKLSPSNYILWEQISLPMWAKRDNVDILHCPGNTAPVYLDAQIKLVVSLMDVMYLKSFSVLAKSESLYQRMGRTYRKMLVPRIIERASKIITISNFSKDDILSHFQGLKHHQIVVTYLAVDDKFHLVDRNDIKARIKAKLRIEGKYILSLGGSDPRKSTELVIEKFIELKDEGRIEEKLVIVGIPNWRRTKFCKMVKESRYSRDIIFTDFVAEGDLVLLYNGATVFLYPSLYEGFGIPPLEAMACGVPVISSDRTSIPEIVGDAALLINPTDGEELKKELTNVLNNESLRNELTTRGYKQPKKFSWRKTAEETLGVYESVYKERS